MSKPLPKKINIFLSLDPCILKGYFNAQDPALLYKRQLSQEFEEYIMNCTRPAKRHSIFNYKISYQGEEHRQYAEPLMYAIRGHFSEKKALLQAEFEKFKRRTYILLFFSLTVVMVCHYLLPLIASETHIIQSGLTNGMDVFSWVILWKPIDRLIFYWNPFLKDISIAEKLAKGEVSITEIEE